MEKLSIETLEERRLLAVIAVDTVLDVVDLGDGNISLREAIIMANQMPGADTIQLVPGTYSLSIPGSGEDAAATGDLDITDDLTIQRIGTSGDVTIDATGLFDRVFHIIAPLASTDPWTTGNGGGVATSSTLLNSLDLVSVNYQGGDKLDIRGQDSLGNPVGPFEVFVSGSSTVGDVLGAINTHFTDVSISIDSLGRIVATGASSAFAGALEVEISDRPSNNGEGSYPGLVGATVAFDNIIITGGSDVMFGGGLLNQNQAQTTLTESALEDNDVTLEGGAFLNDVVGLRGGMVQLINSSMRNNTVLGGFETDILGEVRDLFQDSESSFLGGLDTILGSLSDRIDGAFAALDIPVIGDQLLLGLQPIFDGLTTFATGVRDTLEDIFTLAAHGSGPAITELVQSALFLMLGKGDSASYAMLPSHLQAALQPFRSRFQTLGMGLLKDGPDTGKDVNPTDVVVTIGQDLRGKRWLEYNLHIGQRISVDTPGFSFGLGNLTDFLEGVSAEEKARLKIFLNDMGFEFGASSGIRFTTRWNLRLGLGVSEIAGQDFYINSGATITGALDAPAAKELSALVSVTVAPSESQGFSALSEDVVTTPNLRADVNLGLLQATITDGTPASVNTTAPNGLPALGPFDNEFRITYTDGSGDHIINIDYDQGGLTPLDFVGLLNIALVAADPSFPISATLDFSRINRGVNADAGTTPSLVFNARFPAINNLKLDFASVGGDAAAWGFIDGQFEDRRSKSVGFSNNVSSVLVGGEQVLVAGLDAPAQGKLLDDISFFLWLGGARDLSNVLQGATKVRIPIVELLNRDINSREALRAKLEDVIQTRVTSSTSFDGSTLRVELSGDKFQLISSAGDLLTITSQQVDQTKLKLIAAIDVVDPGFADDVNLLNLKNNPTDQRFFDRLSLDDLKAEALNKTLKPTLKASADINLHVITGASGFLEQQLGVSDGGLGLPDIEFDFKVVGAEMDFLTLFNDDDGDDKESIFSVKSLQFDNITLDVTNTLETVIGPFAEAALGLLEPVFEVLGSAADDPDSVLNTEIPYIGDIVGHPVTIGNIVDAFGLGPAFDAFFEFIEPLQNFDATAIAQEIAGADGRIVFGGLEVVLDPNSLLYFPKIKLPVPIGLADTVDGGSAALSLDSVLSTVASIEIEPGIFKFDLLSVDSIFNMLIGAPFNIVSVGLPVVDIDAEADFGFDFDALSFNIDASASVDVNLRIVYDSLGFQRIIDAFRSDTDPDWLDLLDGFHIQNNPGGEPELGLSIEFFGEGSIDISEFSAEGFVDAGAAIGFNIVDPNDDGKLRLDEIFELTNDFQNPERLLCMFDITGSGYFSAGGSASVAGVEIASGEMGLVGGEFSLQDLLGSVFDVCGTVAPEFEQADPILASEVFEGGERILRIHTGPFAPDRIHVDTDDTDASDGVRVTVTESGGSYTVSIEDTLSNSTFLQSGDTQTFSPSNGSFDKIVIVGTDFDDTFDFSGVSIPVEAQGGLGDDTIFGGSAADVLRGEDGDDELRGNDGPDVLVGGWGQDELFGGAQGDNLDGGGDDDRLRGGSGADTITGGRGDDDIFGEGGNDDLFGESGADFIDGGSGNDNLFGGRGNDTLDDRDGTDTLSGELGDDRLIIGRDSNSLVDGGGGENTLEFADDHLDANAADKSLTAVERATLKATSVDVAALSTSFGNIDLIEITLGDGEDVFTIEAAELPVSFNGQGGPADSDLLIVDRSSAVGPIVGELTATAITGFTTAEITYDTIERLHLLLGSGDDQLTIVSTATATEVKILAGPGKDHVLVQAVGAVELTSIEGELGVDTVTLAIPDNPHDAIGVSNFNRLGLTVEMLVIDHSGAATAVHWKDNRNVVSFNAGSGWNRLIDGLGADRILFLGGDSGTDTLTVTDTVNNPQSVTIDRDSVVIREGARILTPGPATALSKVTYSADLTGLGGTVATAVVEATTVRAGTQTHLYAVSKDDDAIVVFRQESGGRLTFLQEIFDGRNGVEGLLTPADVVVSTDGKFVYVAAESAYKISYFERVPETGRLIYRGAFSNVNRPNGLATYGSNLYATLGNTTVRFSRNTTTGALTRQENVSSGFRAIAITPNGRNIYAVSQLFLRHFYVGPSGVLPSAPTHEIALDGTDVDVTSSSVYVTHVNGVNKYDLNLNLQESVGEAGSPTAIAVTVRHDGNKVIVSYDDESQDSVPNKKFVSFTTLQVVDRVDSFTDDEGTFKIGSSAWNTPGNWIDEGQTKNIGGPARQELNQTRTLRVITDSNGGSDATATFTISASTAPGNYIQPIHWDEKIFGALFDGFWRVGYKVESVPQPPRNPPTLVMYDSDLVKIADFDDPDENSEYRDLTAAPDGSFYGGGSSLLAMYSSNSAALAVISDATVGDGDHKLVDGESQSGIELRALDDDHAATVTAGNFAYTLSAKYGALWVSERNPVTDTYAPIQQVPLPGLIDAAGLTLVGRHVYVTIPTEDTVLAFERDLVTGELDLTPVHTLTDGLRSVTQTVDGLDGARDITSSGGDIYVTGADGDAVVTFDRNSSDGRLQFMSKVTTALDDPVSIRFSGDNRFAYVASRGNDRLVVFSRNSSSGALTHVQTVGGVGDGPLQVVLSSNSNSVYVATGDDSILVFDRDSITGRVELVQTVLGSGLGAVLPLEGLSAITADDQYLFATGKDADMVVAFERDSGTGRLTYQQRLRDGASSVGLGDLDKPTSTSIVIAGDNLLITSGDAGGGGRGLAVFDIERVAPLRINFAADFTGMESLTVTSAGGDDDITLVETVAGLPVVINGLGGDDFFFVDGTTIGGPVTVNAGSPARAPIFFAGAPIFDTHLGTGDVLVFDTKGATTVPNLRDGTTNIFVGTVPNPADLFTFASSGNLYVTGKPPGLIYTSIEEVRRIAAPTSDAGGPYVITEGNGVILDASGSIIPSPAVSGDPIYEWDLNNDGVYDDVVSSSNTVIVPWMDLVSFGLDNGGLFDIALRITNDEGSDLTSTTLTIQDRTLSLSGALQVNEGSLYTMTLGGLLGSEIIVGGTLDWGDGNTTDLAASPATLTHTYADNGLRTISLEAIELDHAGDLVRSEGGNTLLVNVDNVIPALLLSGASSLDEGQDYTLSLFSSDPGADTIIRWNIDWGDGDLQKLTGDPSSVNHRFVDDGVYTIGASAQDEDGTHTFGGRVDDVAPDAGTFRGSLHLLATDDAYNGLFLEFTSGDLTGQRRQITDYVGATRTFVFDIPFFTAPTADDSFALQLDVTVNNLPPTIVGTEVVTPNPLEGSQISVRVEATDPGGAGDPLLYEFDFFNDGSIDAVSFTGQASHFFPDDGAFPVKVVVTDDEGDSDTTFFTLFVANVEPSLTLRGPGFIDEGETYELTLAITDPGDDTLDAYSIDWGDGVVEPFVFVGTPDLTQTHVYVDGDAPTTESFSTTVTIDISVDGGLKDLDLASLDPADDISFWNIDWGDGTVESIRGAADAASHVYQADGSYTITAISGRQTMYQIRVFGLSDEDGDYDVEETLDVTVRNVSPTIDLTGLPLADSRDPFQLILGEVVDPGDDTVIEFRIFWGDGSTFGGLPYQSFDVHPGSVFHTFEDGQNVHTIRVALLDEDGLAPSAGLLIVSNEGAAISAQLSELVERPKAVELEYLGNEGSGSPIGGPFNDAEVFIIASDEARADDPNATLLFFGQILTGERFVVDATAAGLGRLPRHTYLHVFSDVPETEMFTEEFTVESDALEATLNLSELTDEAGVVFWTVDWGDGPFETIAGNPASATHTYTAAGTFLAIATSRRLITSMDPSVDPAIEPALLQTVGIRTNNPALLQVGDRFGSLELTAFTRDDSGYLVDWGDGLSNAYTNDDATADVNGAPRINVEHIYPDNGIYEYTILFRNADGDLSEVNTQRVVVNNVVPTILLDSVSNSSPGCGDAAEGQEISATLSFTDPGFDNPPGSTVEDFTLTTIDWGDGIVETVPDITLVETPGSPGVLTTGTVTGEHVYRFGGIYTITITVRDDDGGLAETTTIAVIAGVGLLDGELQIIGTDEADHAVVNYTQRGSTVRVHSALVSDGNFRDFPAAEINRILFVLCGGDDRAIIAGNIDIDAYLDGGAGNDHLMGGAGNDIILGGPGDDRLFGGAGNDILIGGDGQDRLLGQRGNDLLTGAIYNAFAGDDDDPTASLLSNKAALEPIRDEWSSAKSFSERRGNVTGDDPQPGRLNDEFFLEFGSTLFDDDDDDDLQGGPGLDLLLFDDD